MIDTILLDLDGTLITMAQEDFVRAYFKLLTARLAPLGYSPQAVVDALWQGTAAMVKNDGSQPNAQRFWDSFARQFGLDAAQTQVVRAQCDSFYSNEFNQVAPLMVPAGDAQARAVGALRDKGYRVALATNPIFPPQAVTSRLGWVGLRDEDFDLITHYENIGFCKPNLAYYREICARLGVQPAQCMMVGNSIPEDMCAAQLGMETYLVTGFVEGEGDPGRWPNRGSIADFAAFAAALPNISAG